jgi:hypothetical protein
VIIVVLCEGYLGIKPNFVLWKYYFYTTVFLKMVRRGETVLVRIGSCAILAPPEPGKRVHLYEGVIVQQGVAPEVVLP